MLLSSSILGNLQRSFFRKGERKSCIMAHDSSFPCWLPHFHDSHFNKCYFFHREARGNKVLPLLRRPWAVPSIFADHQMGTDRQRITRVYIESVRSKILCLDEKITYNFQISADFRVQPSFFNLTKAFSASTSQWPAWHTCFWVAAGPITPDWLRIVESLEQTSRWKGASRKRQ